MSKFKISVPQPCTQPWGQMQPSKDGRFCGSCEKEVIDFRTWSMNELVDWFSKADQKVCGHFKSSQLDAVQKDEVRRRTWTFSSKIILASCLTLFTSTKVWSAAQLRSGDAIYEDKNYIKKAVPMLKQSTDTLMIKGRVKDSEGQLGLPSVTVAIKGTTQHVSTDGLGRFKLSVEQKQDKEIILVFTLPGYFTKEVMVSSEKSQDLNVELVVDKDKFLMGEVVIVTTRKPSLWKRLVKFIKNPSKSQ